MSSGDISIRLKRDEDVERFRSLKSETGKESHVEMVRELMNRYKEVEKLDDEVLDLEELLVSSKDFQNLKEVVGTDSDAALLRKVVSFYRKRSPAYRYKSKASKRVRT